jgi:hypothetical protein
MINNLNIPAILYLGDSIETWVNLQSDAVSFYT